MAGYSRCCGPFGGEGVHCSLASEMLCFPGFASACLPSTHLLLLALDSAFLQFAPMVCCSPVRLSVSLSSLPGLLVSALHS